MAENNQSKKTSTEKPPQAAKKKVSLAEVLISLKKTMGADEYQILSAELERLNHQIRTLEEDNLGHIARLQTMARRHGNDQQQALKYGSQDLARGILKPLDLFKKIIKAPVSSEEIKNYLVGFEMIAKQLDQALIDNGIKQIVVKVGDDFNPHYHEATELVETTAVPKGKIAEVNANGYQLHDRVLTHALVKVAK